jgi:hypothetical protein
MLRAREVDERMAALVEQKNRVVAEMILLVQEIDRDRLFRALGATSVTDYMRRRARWEASKTEKVVTLARKLAHLPILRAAFVKGAVGWTTAYIAALAATPETDAEWTGKALTLTNEQLEAERARVAGREVVERVTLKLSPAKLAAVDEAVTAVRRESGKNLSFDEAVVEVCERAVEGGAVGGSKYRVVVTVCADCGKATREGKNGPVEVPANELEAMACDSEVLDVRKGPKAISRTIPPKVASFVQARDRGRCRVPGCRNRAWIHLHHEGGWRNVGHDRLAVYTLCVAHHTARHDGDLVVRVLGPGRLAFFRRDGVLLGEVDLALPADDPAAVTFRAEGAAARPTFRAEGHLETFRAEGPALSNHAGEVALAVSGLRKLGFRDAEARDLVTRAITADPELRLADEIVGAALRISVQKQPMGAA